MVEVDYSKRPTMSLLKDYDFVRLLNRSQVAWEYLRRNPDYCHDWRISRPGRCKPIRLLDDTVLLRIRRRFVGAEAWGLHMFRQSRTFFS